ncbi:MAG: FRG domain-containing protein [Lachnospiraceae bacterium]|nr:FRG domain-containing protein [Lachnospiraceae bacterium]
MNYITERRSSTLSNEPFEITYEDIRRMFLENIKDEAECRRVTESTYRGESYYADDNRPGEGKVNDFRMAFCKEVLYRDMKTAGYMMEYPHGVVISQGERNSYYRGENQIFPKSQPGLYRSLDKLKTEEERRVYRFVSELRIAEFGIFLCRLGIVQFWLRNYGSVLFEPLAQHYGLETDWLDITSDFNVALFFAACGWDSDRKCWYPLKKEQTERNENTKYGALFHIPQWQASMTMCMGVLPQEDESKYHHNVILPIGYQPFMRCQSQHAYGIQMKTPFPLQEDITFEKLRFRHNEKLSREIFERMEGGEKIYPQEGLEEFSDVIEVIKRATEFSLEAFESVLKRSTWFKMAEEAEKALYEVGIAGQPVRIVGERHPFQVSRQRIRAMDRKYQGFSLQKKYGIQLTARMVYRGDLPED